MIKLYFISVIGIVIYNRFFTIVFANGDLPTSYRRRWQKTARYGRRDKSNNTAPYYVAISNQPLYDLQHVQTNRNVPLRRRSIMPISPFLLSHSFSLSLFGIILLLFLLIICPFVCGWYMTITVNKPRTKMITFRRTSMSTTSRCISSTTHDIFPTHV